MELWFKDPIEINESAFFWNGKQNQQYFCYSKRKIKTHINKIKYVKWDIKTDATGRKRISRWYSDQLYAKSKLEYFMQNLNWKSRRNWQFSEYT
jgi:hypothetical protein